MVKELDPDRIAYLHVVPNTTQPFNAVTTCMDDFEVANYCDVFAATMNNGPYFTLQVVSTGAGKICYNVESHINGGRTNMYQTVIEMNDLLNDFLPQIGMGIKGFMFWQYRPEVLGLESPAWGLVNLDGTDRTVTKAAENFWKTIEPYTPELMKCVSDQPETAIWKSQKNEIFHYCEYGNFTSLSNSISSYSDFLYRHNYTFSYVNSASLNNLNNIKVLIMPSCYYLTQQEADAIDSWISGGGVLISEAHLGAYNDYTGRHSYSIPGCGLDKKWGIKEVETTSTYRLRLNQNEQVNLKVEPDVKKMLADFGTTGGQYVPVAMTDGSVLFGAYRFAKIEASDAEPLGYFENDYPTLISKRINKGMVYYCGTNIGEGSTKNKESFNKFLSSILEKSRVNTVLNSKTENVWVKSLSENGRVKFIVVRNMEGKENKATLQFEGSAKGLFSGMDIKPGAEVKLARNFCDIFPVN